MNIFKKNTVLHPENSGELLTWSRKWNITIQELGRAIVETGTVNIHELRRYIRRNKYRKHSSNVYPGISDLSISQ